jgi:hypothetical protein
MTIKAKDFEHIVNKFGLRTRNSGDRLVWFEHEGKIITRTRRSNIKGRDLPFQHSIRQQLKLNEDEFREAVACHLDRDQYLMILRQKGLL